MIPVPLAHFDVLARSARCLAQILIAADREDRLSSAMVRATARAHGIAQMPLFTDEFDAVVGAFDDMADQEAEPQS